MLFRSGDLIVVPELEARITVLGQVLKSGTFPLPEKKTLTIIDALALCGGLTQTAEVRKAALVKTVDGKPVTIKINLQDITVRGNLEKNYVMQAGDVLFIPQRGRSITLNEALSPLFILGGLGLRPF